MSDTAHKETLGFQTEIQQLLKLMIHSLYSNKEIFLRELISNASDAGDKLRFEALTDTALFEGDAELKIRVSCDKEAKTITVTDNGIGMSRQEVIDNIGTIAKSGTKAFLESLTGEQAQDARLIGQFGVGFYSVFMVADKVTLTTRRAGLTAEHGVRWESDGSGTYSIETVERSARGTQIVLHLKPEEEEFLEPWRVRPIISKYSDHISLPILMPKEGEEGGEEMVNRASALWARPKKEITADEYNEFYKHIAHDFTDPLAHVHTRAEGNQSYITLFFIPQRAPFDLWDRDQRHGVKLYVKRVFIMDDAEHLMPNYLRFVRGIVDADDLPLNVSREILQKNRLIDAIRTASVKKVLGLLEDLAKNDKEKYATFWHEFGRVLKEGPGEDFANRERIAGLLRFASTHSDSNTQDVSLDDYLARLREGQDKIYYIVAESAAAARHSPHLEIFRKKGIEVLLLWDRVDEWLMSHLSEYQGKSLQSVAKGDLDLGKLADSEEKRVQEVEAGQAQEVIERMKQVLGEKVKEVRVSHRLTDSPSCVVVDQHEYGLSMQKILKAAGHSVPTAAPILEINPTHPLIRGLKDIGDTARFADWTNILLEQALLAEGAQLEDPAAFVRRVNGLLLGTTLLTR